MYNLVTYKTRFNHYTNETHFLPLKYDIQDYFQVKKLYHTGHIYIAFHHCVFSDDIQKQLFERQVKKLYHTGHIYIAFHHCVFSDDIQKQLFEQNFYHTPHI